VWRLVIERVATLQELDAHWPLDDIARANALLDMRRDAKVKAAKDAERRRR
jgi:ABC-type uncharacterized transport system substrate-binding protein